MVKALEPVRTSRDAPTIDGHSFDNYRERRSFIGKLRVLNARRHPFGIELLVPLVLLNLTVNLADAVLANILSPTSYINDVAELIVRSDKPLVS